MSLESIINREIRAHLTAVSYGSDRTLLHVHIANAAQGLARLVEQTMAVREKEMQEALDVVWERIKSYPELEPNERGWARMQMVVDLARRSAPKKI